MSYQVRKIIESDIPELKAVLNSIELFPAEMLNDMISDYLSNAETEELWFTAIENDKPIAIGYCAPEKLTVGTFNLHAIGVRSDLQGKGIGSAMMEYLESTLKAKNHRILIVDTSGTDDFKLTRKFYENLDYHKESVIRDFWDEGDDKVSYWKKLN